MEMLVLLLAIAMLYHFHSKKSSWLCASSIVPIGFILIISG